MEKREQSDRTSYDTNLLIRVFRQARYLTKDHCESLWQYESYVKKLRVIKQSTKTLFKHRVKNAT